MDVRLVRVMHSILDNADLARAMGLLAEDDETPQQTTLRLRKAAIDSLLPDEIAWLEQQGIQVSH